MKNLDILFILTKRRLNNMSEVIEVNLWVVAAFLSVNFIVYILAFKSGMMLERGKWNLLIDSGVIPKPKSGE